jgi:hypothetical protein
MARLAAARTEECMSDNMIRPTAESRTRQETVTILQRDDDAPALAESVIGEPEVHTTTKETLTVAGDPRQTSSRRIRRGILFAANLLAILISIRIVLALLGANPESIFAAIIYTITGIFTFPFQGLFGAWIPPAYGVTVFEASSLVAIAIYYLIAWAALRIQALRDQRNATTRTEVVSRETRVKP